MSYEQALQTEIVEISAQIRRSRNADEARSLFATRERLVQALVEEQSKPN